MLFDTMTKLMSHGSVSESIKLFRGIYYVVLLSGKRLSEYLILGRVLKLQLLFLFLPILFDRPYY